MRIRIPPRVADAWDRYEEWANVPIYERGKFEIRRIDILLVFFGMLCIAYYGWTSGWQGALMGGIMYAVVAALALWVF